MKKELTKADRDVLMSVIHDARTLDKQQVDSLFNSYRAVIDEERKGSGLPLYDECNMAFIHSMFALFFRQGFEFAIERIFNAFQAVTEYVNEVSES